MKPMATVQPVPEGADDDTNLTTLASTSLAVGAVAAFHLAYTFASCAFLMAVFLGCVYGLGWQGTGRRAFYWGLGVGLACYVPHLDFFRTIFGPAAAALWVILAAWIGLFLVLVRITRRRMGLVWAAALAPFFWTGLEYFRSELYYLRFSWLNVGYAFSDCRQLFVVAGVGTYGIGFVLMGVASLLWLAPRRWAWPAGGVLLALFGLWTNLPAPESKPAAGSAAVRVAGVQMEMPAELETVGALGVLHKTYPTAELLVLSEYTYDGPVPRRVKGWCERNGLYLVAGGKRHLEGEQYRNTAWVIDPRGQEVFAQTKAVPIQFFKDGLPAQEQRPWHSPWGRIGLAICYDLSYTRVMDRLVEQQAQTLIVPTMDLVEGGAYQHRLHARVAPLRAAEYGLAIFRVASSGVSQLVDGRGRVAAVAPAGADQVMLGGELPMAKAALVPLDRHVALPATLLTGFLMLWFVGVRASGVGRSAREGWRGLGR